MQLFGIRTSVYTVIIACTVFGFICSPAVASDAEVYQKTGTFSSMYYHEEGGDLLGIELRIVYTRDGYEGVLQFGEGEPSRLTIVEPIIHGNSISFNYCTKFSGGHFDGVYTETGIAPKTPDKESGWNLRRKSSYWE